MRPICITSILALALLPCACLAGEKKASTEFPTFPLVASEEAPAASLDFVTTPAPMVSAAAEAEMIPDAPSVIPDTFTATTTLVMTTPKAEPARRLTVADPEFAPGASPLLAMPLVSTAMRMGGDRFNTTDGSSVSAFAICYRLSGRSSLQVIPGDPAPVKIPVSTFANNVGVTVGMVFRLPSHR